MGQKNTREPNPLLEPWTGPFEAPPFDRLKPSHFGQAFEIALGLAQAETGAIAADPKPPSFENTIEALERSGRELTRVCSSTWRAPAPMTRLRRSNARSRQDLPGIAAESI